MKLANVHLGLLINFNVPILKEGIKRKINGRLENTTVVNIKDFNL
jgi:hypothetical protein